SLHTVLDVALPVGLFILALILLGLGDRVTEMLAKMSGAAFARWGHNFVVYLIPLAICFLYTGRPVRFGLGLGAVMLASGLYTNWTEKSRLYTDRSYFSIIRVEERPWEGNRSDSYRTLIHATTNHGMNFMSP